MGTFNVTNQRRGTQQAALFSAIARSATSLLSSGTLPQDMLEGVNHKHCALNVQPAQYDVVAEHILGTITDLLNPGQAVLDAWGELYVALADQCIKREEEIYKDVESRAGGWRGIREFVVTEKTVMSKHITSFTFEPTDGKEVANFSAGQYTTIWFQAPGWEHRQPRHYSLTNAPNGTSYSIAVKKEEKGLVSGHLHDRVAVGDKVELSPPYGDFNIAGCEKLWTSAVDAPIVLMSAGVVLRPCSVCSIRLRTLGACITISAMFCGYTRHRMDGNMHTVTTLLPWRRCTAIPLHAACGTANRTLMTFAVTSTPLLTTSGGVWTLEM